MASMLDGDHGPTKQKAASLVVDLASTAGAKEFIRASHAHVSGVSVITGGHGLRRFLADLSGDKNGKVAIPTTLNSLYGLGARPTVEEITSVYNM